MPNMSTSDGIFRGVFNYPASYNPSPSEDYSNANAVFQLHTTNKFVDKDAYVYLYLKRGAVTPTVSYTGMNTYFTITDNEDTASISLSPSANVTEGYVKGNVPGNSSYWNIRTFTPTYSGGEASLGTITYTKSGVTTTTTNNGISLTPSVPVNISELDYGSTGAGWLDVTNGDKIRNASSSTIAGSPIYISKITVPKDKAFAVETTADTALDTTSDLTITNNAFRQTAITNNGTVSIIHLTPGKGNVTIAGSMDTAYTNVIQNGDWVTPNITGAGTYYGKVVLASGVYNADASSVVNTAIVTMPYLTGSDTFGVTTTQPSGTAGTDYLVIDSDVKTASDWSVTPRANVTTAGYVAVGSLLGNTITRTPTHSSTDIKYIPKASITFSSPEVQVTKNTNTVTTTPSVSVDAGGTFISSSNYGVTSSKPSGTDGTNYLTISPTGSANSGTAVAEWSVTVNSIGYTMTKGVSSGASGTAMPTQNTSDSKTVTLTPTVSLHGDYYIPITSVNITGGALTKTDFAKNDLSVTLASGSETNMSNITLGAKSTTTYPYYFKVNGSTPAVEGTTTVERATVTYSNSAGAIEAHSAGTSAISADSLDANVSVNAASGSTYISLKKATFSVTANKVYCNAAGYIGADATNAVGTIPTGTIVNNTTLPSGSSSSGTLNRGNYIKIGAGYYANDLYYMAATNSGGTITIEHGGNSGVDGYAIAYVPYSTITYGTTTVSGSTATRGAVTITSGWIDTTSTPTNPDISRLGVATFANTASAGTTYVDISSTSAAPVLISGDYLYINEGWTDNLKISLAKLVPDVPSGKTVAPANYILSGYAAFDEDGTVIAGTMETYNGAYTITYN